MLSLDSVVDFCDTQTFRKDFKDFPFAFNGLQLQNKGSVSKIGAAVDANFETFKKAKEDGVDFLILHHGLFWEKLMPITELSYEKLSFLISNNIAVYSSHLPLDAHEKIGNNAIIAQSLGLTIDERFLSYEGNNIGVISKYTGQRSALKSKLLSQFPHCISIEYGSIEPKRIGIVSGSANISIEEMKAAKIDTLITGELKQRYFSLAQDEKWNLYLCGHYATETFGVNALGKLVAQQFNLNYKFLESECPL